MLFEHAGHDSEVLPAEPLINGLLPFVSQAGEGGEPVVGGSLQREAHVLKRKRQRELGGRTRRRPIRCSLAACQGDTSGPPPSASITVSVAIRNGAGQQNDSLLDHSFDVCLLH